jgi:hypothetical protein
MTSPVAGSAADRPRADSTSTAERNTMWRSKR